VSHALSTKAIEDPLLGPASMLLLRVLRERAAVAFPYRASSAASSSQRPSEGDDDAKGRGWVAKVLGEPQGSATVK
jgi:hypothetical protein